MALLGLKIPKTLPQLEEAKVERTIGEWRQQIIEEKPEPKEVKDFIVALNQAYGDCRTRSARLKIDSISV